VNNRNSKRPGNTTRQVLRTVVHNDNLIMGADLGQNCREEAGKIPLLIESRDDD
jgi:hypothetical protein